MSSKEIIKDDSNVTNLIAIGAFLWYFLNSLGYLFFIGYKFIGIVFGMEPIVLFWTNQILYIVIMCIVLRFWITKMWRQIDLNLINIKRLLIKIGIAIILIHALQFLYGLYVSDYLIVNFESSLTSYRDAVNTIDTFNQIVTGFDIIGTLILLLLFIKWE